MGADYGAPIWFDPNPIGQMDLLILQDLGWKIRNYQSLPLVDPIDSAAVTGTAGNDLLDAAGDTDTLVGIQGVQFADHLVIVAATPGQNALTTGNITELYAADWRGRSAIHPGFLPELAGPGPTSDDVAFYQGKVMVPALAGLTPGSPAYQPAQLQAHAQMLVYFSASAEFLRDVQITAADPAGSQHWLFLA